MNRPFLQQLLIVGIAAALYFTALGQTSLWDEDEAFFAATAAEMHRHNDWILPTFNEELFGHKPPFMYWIMRLGFLMFGVNELGARFGSAVFGIATALVVYHLGRILFSRSAGFWGALVFSTSIMWGVVARASTADSYLVFFISAALLVYVNDVFGSGLVRRSFGVPHPEPDSVDGVLDRWLPGRARTFIAIYLLMGLAVLVKGPIGVLLPGVTVGLFVLSQMPVSMAGQSSRLQRMLARLRPFVTTPALRTFWRMRPITAVLCVAATAGPWFALVSWKTGGAFLQEFIGVHNIGRFMSPMENHRGPIVYYIPVMLVGLFPWTIFILPTFSQAGAAARGSEQRPQYLFVICWAAWMVGFFSIARTKLPNYVLPAYPAVALMTGAWINAWVTRREITRRRWPALAFGSQVAVGLILIGGLWGAGNLRSGGVLLLEKVGVNAALAPDLASLAWLGILPLCGGTAAWALVQRDRRKLAACVTAASCVGFSCTVLIIAAGVLNKHQTSAAICEAVRAQAQSGPVEWGSFRNSPPSVVFYAGDRVERFGRADAAAQFLESGSSRYLITTDAGLAQLEEAGTTSLQRIGERPRFPRTGRVLAVTPERVKPIAVTPDSAVSR